MEDLYRGYKRGGGSKKTNKDQQKNKILDFIVKHSISGLPTRDQKKIFEPQAGGGRKERKKEIQKENKNK